MAVAAHAAALADFASWASGPPHGLFDDLRSVAPVHWVPGEWGTLDSGGYWAVLSHAHVMDVARNPETFTSTRGAAYPSFAEEVVAGRAGMMLQDDPEHQRHRRLAGRAFSPRVVAEFDGWVRSITAATLDAAYGRDEFDFVDEVASVIPARVIAELMGVPEADQQAVAVWTKGLFERDTPTRRDAANKARHFLLEYSMHLRDLKRGAPGVDLISELVAAEGEGHHMSEDEYRYFIMLLLAAGFETTHTLMSQMVRMILEDQQIEAGARAAVANGGVKPLTEEFLRMISPPMNMARFAAHDAELGGQEMAAGQMVVMWFIAANRDPEVFIDPHRFVADRDPNNHVAFGPPGSPHYCLGHALGRLEGRVLLEDLLERPRLRLAGPPVPSGGVFINALRALPVRVA
ncbi:MAG: cytochrome P450 [Acidimicrobiales bacterium]